jgi:hypothetical protein
MPQREQGAPQRAGPMLRLLLLRILLLLLPPPPGSAGLRNVLVAGNYLVDSQNVTVGPSTSNITVRDNHINANDDGARVNPPPSQGDSTWSTVPVFWQGANASGVLSDSQAHKLAQFPMVVFSKVHGRNALGGATVEESAQHSCAQLKQIKPTLVCLFYLNAHILEKNYRVSDAFEHHHRSWLLHRPNGSLMTIPNRNHPANPFLVPDLGRPEAGRLFFSDVVNVTTRPRSSVDGASIDRYSLDDEVLAKEWASPDLARRFYAGQTASAEWMAQRLGPKHTVFVHCDWIRPYETACRNWSHIPTPGIMSECFWPAQREMEALEDAVVHSGKKIQVETKVNCTDHGQFITALAAFLVVAGPDTWFMCGGFANQLADGLDPAPFLPEYAKVLGAPLSSVPVKHPSGTWTRAFAFGTNVSFHTKSTKGEIFWADGEVSVGTIVHQNTKSGWASNCNRSAPLSTDHKGNTFN